MIGALLNLFVPGLGHLCQGRLSGILWFFAVLLGYMMFIIPGLILHVLCVMSAALHGDKPQQVVIIRDSSSSN